MQISAASCNRRSISVEMWPQNIPVAKTVEIPAAASDTGSEIDVQRSEDVPESEPDELISEASNRGSENVKQYSQNIPESMDRATPLNLNPDIVQDKAVPLHEIIPFELNMSNSNVISGTTTPPNTSADSSVLQEIHPLPQSSPKKTNRRRKLQKSEVLTSTPIKMQQKEKFEKGKIKQEKTHTKKIQTTENLKNIQHKVNLKKTQNKENLKKTRPSTSGSAKRQKISTIQCKISEKECYCLVCKKLYVDPPAEDWIMCSQCKEWAHEACTTYCGHGSFFCELCFD
ncbi:unnamed protein product [Diatraea saccharalis]|uniref:Zinc finger PHD-type domain-containing protein n=1 Tax=Diatraea saccharalis TaxID=40085 RepID=A0A9N9WJD2_9NEOP|nr:unnamed protein product [Diatraea saccharalis]